jgi:hypothetical protein
MATFNLTGYMYSHNINIVASVVEEGTGKRGAPWLTKKREWGTGSMAQVVECLSRQAQSPDFKPQ